MTNESSLSLIILGIVVVFAFVNLILISDGLWETTGKDYEHSFKDQNDADSKCMNPGYGDNKNVRTGNPGAGSGSQGTPVQPAKSRKTGRPGSRPVHG